MTVRSLSGSNPATLSVNRKSRTETLRYYRLIFRPDRALRGDTIYFNPTIDRAFVRLYKMTRESVMRSLRQVQRDSVIEDINTIPIMNFDEHWGYVWWERELAESLV